MSQSLSQRLKRCSRYGTLSRTPKRPCFTAGLSTTAGSTDSDPSRSNDMSSENCTEETETASSDSFPRTPCGSDRITVSTSSGTDCSSTPRNTSGHVASSTSTDSPAARSMEELQQRRAQLRNGIASKEQTLHNLNLVKLHRAKVGCFLQHSYRSRFMCTVSCNL